MNKKGGVGSFFGEHVVSIVITIIVVIFIFVLFAKITGYFTTESELEKAEKELKKVAEVVRTVQQTEGDGRIEFYAIENWFLRTFPDSNYPNGECVDSSVISCLCYCEDFNCEEKRMCEGFKFDVALRIIEV